MFQNRVSTKLTVCSVRVELCAGSEDIQQVSELMKTIHGMDEETRNIKQAITNLENAQGSANQYISDWGERCAGEYAEITRQLLVKQKDYLKQKEDQRNNRQRSDSTVRHPSLPRFRLTSPDGTSGTRRKTTRPRFSRQTRESPLRAAPTATASGPELRPDPLRWRRARARFRAQPAGPRSIARARARPRPHRAGQARV